MGVDPGCATLVVAVAATRTVATAESQAPAAQALQSIGPLAFGPDGVLFAADRQAATIFAIDLGAKATGGAPGAKDVTGIDTQIASMLGTDPKEVQITDLAVHPKSQNAFISVMRGTGADAKPALLRVDGAGKIEVVALDGLEDDQGDAAERADGRCRRAAAQSADGIDHRHGVRRRQAGRRGPLERGVLVEAPHGPVSLRGGGCRARASRSITATTGSSRRARRSSRSSPTSSTTPQHLIAGYTCTPLVKFPVSSLAPGAKVMGTTIAELGNRNRPTDMIVYKKGGKDYLLIANTSRGVMKVATDGFATAPGITAKVATETGGVGFEPMASLKGVEQLDLLDAQRAIVLTRAEGGALSLQAVALP